MGFFLNSLFEHFSVGGMRGRSHFDPQVGEFKVHAQHQLPLCINDL